MCMILFYLKIRERKEEAHLGYFLRFYVNVEDITASTSRIIRNNNCSVSHSAQCNVI